MVKPLKGRKVITFHRSWSYFANFCGMQVVGEVEMKPGVSPSPAHLGQTHETDPLRECDLADQGAILPGQVPKLLA